MAEAQAVAPPGGAPDLDRDVLLRVDGLSKTFGVNRVLDGLSLDVRSGDIVALLGQNGSGKSTAVKCLAGFHRPDPDGTLSLRGPDGELHPLEQVQGMLHTIHQDLGLIQTLTVAENLALGHRDGIRALRPVLKAAENDRVRDLMNRFGLSIDPRELVARLTPAERTIVAIARAMDGWASPKGVLVVDEATASLHDEEAEQVFRAVRQVASAGGAVIYVSHRLDEVDHLCNRVVVLRDGRLVADIKAGDVDHAGLVRLITGAEATAGAVIDRTPGAPLVQVDDLWGPRVDGCSFRVHAGEIVGVAGIVGSGREQVGGLVTGAQPRTSGTVRVGGEQVGDTPSSAVAAGVGHVPADRARAGAIMTMSLRENLTLPGLKSVTSRFGRIVRRAEVRETRTWLHALDTRPADPERAIQQLSGGNQQKVVLAKWLRQRPRLLVLDDPTQGVDIAAKAIIYEQLSRAAAAGAAILITSSDAKELVANCDRVLVMRAGRIARELAGATLTETQVVHESLSSVPTGASEPMEGKS